MKYQSLLLVLLCLCLVLPAAAVEVVELTSETEYTYHDECVFSGAFADVLTDELVADGWIYYYSKGTDNPAASFDWVKADGTYTSGELIIPDSMLRDQTEDFLSRADGLLIYNAPADFDMSRALDRAYISEVLAASPQTEVLDLTPLQMNPGQLDEYGYDADSLDAVLLNKGDESRMKFFADISEPILRSWENPNDTHFLYIFFSFDDDVIFAADLHKITIE